MDLVISFFLVKLLGCRTYSSLGESCMAFQRVEIIVWFVKLTCKLEYAILDKWTNSSCIFFWSFRMESMIFLRLMKSTVSSSWAPRIKSLEVARFRIMNACKLGLVVLDPQNLLGFQRASGTPSLVDWLLILHILADDA